MGDTAFPFRMEGCPPDLPPLQIYPVDIENASPFLESHESHVADGKSYDFGYVPHKGSQLKFKLQCEPRFPIFPTTYLFPVGALTGNKAFVIVVKIPLKTYRFRATVGRF